MDNLDFGMLAATKNFTKKSNDQESYKINPELRNIISKMMLSRNRDNLYELMDYMVREKEKMPGY
jgi:23S rRNA maturation mini-RNase III